MVSGNSSVINDYYGWSGEFEFGEIDDGNSSVIDDCYSWSGDFELGDIDDQKCWM